MPADVKRLTCPAAFVHDAPNNGDFMLTGRVARITATAIVLIAVASAAFRIITAPERIAQRRAADAQVCAANGGSMIKVGNNERCVKPAPPN